MNTYILYFEYIKSTLKPVGPSQNGFQYSAFLQEFWASFFKFHTSEKPDGRKKCADAKTLKIPAKLLAVTVRSASSNVHFGKEESTSLSFTDY